VVWFGLDIIGQGRLGQILIVISLGKGHSDNINRMITLSVITLIYFHCNFGLIFDCGSSPCNRVSTK
jgi:hypothetical protein